MLILLLRASGVSIALMAAGLILWAMLADRARGRRRCPRCWYEMTRLPGLVCPECGHTARSERSLSRTRRRLRPAAAGVLLLALGAGVGLLPEVRRLRTVSWIPRPALIALMEVDERGGRLFLEARARALPFRGSGPCTGWRTWETRWLALHAGEVAAAPMNPPLDHPALHLVR